MKTNELTIFFRNDDPDVFYYGDKRDILYMLTDLFIEKEIPLVHAVVPKTVTDRTVHYFNQINKKSNLLEFIQHGWKHSRYSSGEFDNSRSYKQQLNDIRRGKSLMYDLFADSFFLGFTAPYGIYTRDTFRILSSERFKVVSSRISFTPKRRYFDRLGRLLRTPVLFGKRIAYHGRTVAKYAPMELSISVNITKKIPPFEVLSKNKILDNISFASAFTKNIGVLLHHVTLNKDHCKMLAKLIEELKTRNYSFATLSEIYRRI